MRALTVDRKFFESKARRSVGLLQLESLVESLLIVLGESQSVSLGVCVA